MSEEHFLLRAYEKAVATLVAHAALHAPHGHEHDLRELVLRGERFLCDRCEEIRTALVAAADEWRAVVTLPAKHEPEFAPVHLSHVHLGLAG